jgi:hypothetical protein
MARVALDKNLYLHDICIDTSNINHQRLHYINRVRLLLWTSSLTKQIKIEFIVSALTRSLEPCFNRHICFM